MAAPIERQLHEFLLEQEEARARAEARKLETDPETSGRKVKRRAIAKPWTRPTPVARLQDVELLAMIREFDYDLADEAFQGYCAARGVLHVAGEPGSPRWALMADPKRSRSAFLEDPYFRTAEEVDGSSYRYTDAEMDQGWKAIHLGRAELQDCWELYRAAAGRAPEE